MKKNIIIFDTSVWNTSYQEQYNKSHAGHSITYISESLTPQRNDLIAKCKDAHIIALFVHSKITKEMLDKMPNLQMIALRSTGFDHVDLDACNQRNIVVSNVPAYGDNTVAEYAFGLLLSLARQLNTADARTRAHKFVGSDLVGFDMKGKTIGLIGGGKIGVCAARIANGFGMKVLVYDLFQDPAKAKDAGFTYVSLETIFAQSDIISLHTPCTPQTTHMINEKTISSMKKGVVIINTARGPLIESKALLNALNNGHVSGAGLDVVENEKLLMNASMVVGEQKVDHDLLIKLVTHPHVIYTPHNAYNSRESLARIEQVTQDNINAFLAGNSQHKVKNL